MNNFKKRLRTVLDELNLTQGEFAETLATKQSTVSKWLDTNSNNGPTIEQLSMIATVYKINLTWLLNGLGEIFLKDDINYIASEPNETYKLTELEKAQKKLLECREETLELYRVIHKKAL